MTAISTNLRSCSLSASPPLTILTPPRRVRRPLGSLAALDFGIEQLHYNPATGATLRLRLRVARRRVWAAQSDAEQDAWHAWTLPGGIVVAYQLAPLPG